MNADRRELKTRIQSAWTGVHRRLENDFSRLSPVAAMTTRMPANSNGYRVLSRRSRLFLSELIRVHLRLDVFHQAELLRVDGVFEIAQDRHRFRVAERKELHHNHGASPAVRVDPEEGVLDSGPSQAACG